MAVSPQQSIITVYVKWTKFSNQKTEWLSILKKQTNKKPQDLTIYCLQETHFSFKETHRLKVTG